MGGRRLGYRAKRSVPNKEVKQTEAAALLAASRTVRVMSKKRILIMSELHLNDLNFNRRSIFIINSMALRSLAGLIGIAVALFLILFPSLACAVHITLAWDPNDEPDVAGYIVYYGRQSRDYDYDVDVGDYNSVTISGLVEDVRYYFAVTAYDSEGNESDFSQEIAYPRTTTSTFSASDTSGGGNNRGCFVTVASENSANSDQNEILKKFAMIALVISLLLAALLSRCVPLPRTRQQ